MIDNIQIGKKLKAARESAGLTQSEIANLLELDKRTICSYEKGRARIPAIAFFKIAEYLNMSVDEIMDLHSTLDGRTIEGKLKREFMQIQRLDEKKQKAILQFISTFLNHPVSA